MQHLLVRKNFKRRLICFESLEKCPNCRSLSRLPKYETTSSISTRPWICRLDWGEHGLISRNSHDRNPNICRSLIRTSSNARATCGSQLRITRVRSVHLFVLPHGFSSKGETTRSLPVVHCCTPLPVLHALNWRKTLRIQLTYPRI